MHKIADMSVDDIPEALELLRGQLDRHCVTAADFWKGGHEAALRYLKRRIGEGRALAVRHDGRLAGFLAYMYFDFHGDETAFCPTVGHAAERKDRNQIYHALYCAASRRWVDDGKFNHLWMLPNGDAPLREMFCDVGFGGYVADAFQRVAAGMLARECPYPVRKAVPADVDGILDLANETQGYYAAAPIFLRRDAYTREEILEMLQSGALFAAFDGGRPIGFMNVSVEQDYDIETLTFPGCASIDGVGAYIRPQYRSRGIGSKLLKEVFDHCFAQGIPYVHVSFETSNPFANAFWRKYFDVGILSVRRAVNRDANG